jgi:splicing factor 3B subunit 1
MSETPKRRSRWDARTEDDEASLVAAAALSAAKDEWKMDADADPKAAPASRRSRWDDDTPRTSLNGWDESSGPGKSRWDDATPRAPSSGSRWDDATPRLASSGSRWDDATPRVLSGGVGSGVLARRWEETPLFGVGPGGAARTASAILAERPELLHVLRAEKDVFERNRPWTPEALDALLPATGYAVVEPPEGYVPLRRVSGAGADGPAALLARLATPTPVAGGGGFHEDFFRMQEDDLHAADLREAADAAVEQLLAGQQAGPGLPELRADDAPHFQALLRFGESGATAADPEEARSARIQALLLKIKNGQPHMRKAALRQITDRAREFGPDALFTNILPILMSPSLENHERHLVVKVVDRVLYKLSDQVRPFVQRILVVIEPLLLEEDAIARAEGREIIANLAKAAGLPTMIGALRKDIDSSDDHVRSATARTLAVVASALGIGSVLPFLRAVTQSRKSWEARHTGARVVQQLAAAQGVSVLPQLRPLVETVGGLLEDEHIGVRSMAALALAALAAAAAPYGIECFDSVLRPLWFGIRKYRSKVLAAFLKAIGYIIPLMEPEFASYYTKEVMTVLLREFASPDPDMKKVVLKVVKQCIGTAGVTPEYVRAEIVPEFFKHFWERRMALDRRNYRQLVETTVEIARSVGAAPVTEALVVGLKDESEPYRRMVAEAFDRMFSQTSHLRLRTENLSEDAEAAVAAGGGGAAARRVVGGADVSGLGADLERQLVDGLQFAFQEQSEESTKARGPNVFLQAFGNVLVALGERAAPYLRGVISMIKWRLNNMSAHVRQQAAELVARIAALLVLCREEAQLSRLSLVLFEYLGEEYPEVLGSILTALRAVVGVVGVERMTPPIGELLPRLTPILRNRHERVQEAVVDLVGRIAERAREHVSPREWIRICFELLDLLKAPKKSVRRAAVATFGHIANAIGPHDVTPTLLNNLRVQERTNRVCTTVAIAIVSDTCGPFAVLPALMNEYLVPELKVRQGVLKSLAFMFEYIGRTARDYVYAVVPLVADALMDRDAVHRQTACVVVKYLALGVRGLGCEDAIAHLLNFVWPNIFETSPHVINAVFEAIEACRLALGSAAILRMLLAGLFHPARRVREVYWKLYNATYIAAPDAMVAAYPRVASLLQFDAARDVRVISTTHSASRSKISTISSSSSGGTVSANLSAILPDPSSLPIDRSYLIPELELFL